MLTLEEGACQLRHGRSPGPAGYDSASTTLLAPPEADQSDWQWFGITVAGQGDGDGDSHTDLLVGATGTGGAGAAYLFPGGSRGMGNGGEWGQVDNF